MRKLLKQGFLFLPGNLHGCIGLCQKQKYYLASDLKNFTLLFLKVYTGSDDGKFMPLAAARNGKLTNRSGMFRFCCHNSLSNVLHPGCI